MLWAAPPTAPFAETIHEVSKFLMDKIRLSAIITSHMKISDEDKCKVITCMTLIHEVATDPAFPSRYPDPGAECRRRLGAGWNLMTVMQWMTGKKAVAAISALPLEVEVGGLSGQALMLFHYVAMEFCAEHDASAAATGGRGLSLADIFNSERSKLH